MNKGDSTLYIGIDPGKEGCVVVNYKGEIEAFPFPLIDKEYNINGMAEIFSDLKVLSNTVLFTHCVLEDVHAIFGSAAGSTFEFGYGVGLVEMGLATYKIPYTKVAPKKWQKEMFEGIPVIKKLSKSKKREVTDTKKMAELAVSRLFPKYKLTATVKLKKEGERDALLMCEYCKRNF